MERRGECNHCGWCCQFEGVRRNVVRAPDGGLVHPDDVHFYTLRGGRVTSDGRAVLYVVYDSAPCSAHHVNKSCSIYENRPLTCQEFPSAPAQIEGTPCSHWFEEVVDGKIVRGEGSLYPTPPVFEG